MDTIQYYMSKWILSSVLYYYVMQFCELELGGWLVLLWIKLWNIIYKGCVK